jgi:hypothetical protein
MAKKTAPEEKNQGGRPSFTPTQVVTFKKRVLELLPQGWTVRRILAEPGMCSMSYFFAELLPKDKQFQEQYARAMDLRNDHWADELIDIADDGSDNWFETKFGPKFNKEAAERSKIRIEARKWLMGKSQPQKYGEKVDVTHAADKNLHPSSS